MKKNKYYKIFIGIALILMAALCAYRALSYKLIKRNAEDKGIESIIDKLPFNELKINDEIFSLKNISTYQEKGESGYGYFPCVIAVFDLSNLSKQCLYWINKDDAMSVSCYITSKSNNVDFKPIPLLKAYYDAEELVYIFNDYTEEYKHDFSDAEWTVCVDIEQDDTYKFKRKNGTTGALNKTNKYTVYINQNSGIKSAVQDISKISETEAEMRNNGLNEAYQREVDFYNSVLEN